MPGTKGRNMRMQLVCHQVGAPLIRYRNTFQGHRKRSFNLESWQYARNLRSYIFAGGGSRSCNPGGNRE